ncbi:phosphatidylserine decarboxylase-domain-containing protein [Cubamyces lactineus]|nr:phosphatidylserine decarboxylase-domain-containing protein [Cubamyces lactineus]
MCAGLRNVSAELRSTNTGLWRLIGTPSHIASLPPFVYVFKRTSITAAVFDIRRIIDPVLPSYAVYYTPTTPVVQKLVGYFFENPEFRAAFEQLFQMAYATGLKEFETFNIRSVDDYLRYMDDFIRWVSTEDTTGTNVYNHFCMFYFILDLPPVRDHQTPIDPSARSPWRWLSEWLIGYAKDMGSWMDIEDSINETALQTFAASSAYRDTPETDFFEQYPRPSNGWKTFNEFLARRINPSFRAIADDTDSTVIVSPADCTFDGTWLVNEDSAYVTTFDVKGVPWSISQLLDDEARGADYGRLFAGGVFTHSFVNTTDYHLVLEAGDGSPGSSSRLRMQRAITSKAQGSTSERKDDEIAPGYQFLQARALVLIDSQIGLVAVLSIGMAQMSSVMLTVTRGEAIEKGQEISYFQFGGSDVVMVFQKDAKVQLDQVKGTHYKLGSRIGTGQTMGN